MSGRVWHKTRDIKWFYGGNRRPEWECNRWNAKWAGKEITYVGVDGYKRCSILKKYFQLHRLIWLYMTGEWPKGEIDHINGDRSDNRWCNLRDVSHKENSINLKLSKRNTSGTIGVSFNKREKSWIANIQNKEGKQTYLGTFKTKEMAVAARKAAEIEFGYHPNHGRKANA